MRYHIFEEIECPEIKFTVNENQLYRNVQKGHGGNLSISSYIFLIIYQIVVKCYSENVNMFIGLLRFNSVLEVIPVVIYRTTVIIQFIYSTEVFTYFELLVFFQIRNGYQKFRHFKRFSYVNRLFK